VLPEIMLSVGSENQMLFAAASGPKASSCSDSWQSQL